MRTTSPYLYFSESPDFANGCWQCQQLLAMPPVVGNATGCWQCHRLLAMPPVVGNAIGCWQCHRLLAMTHCRYMSNHKISGDKVRSSDRCGAAGAREAEVVTGRAGGAVGEEGGEGEEGG